jgi:hypothetical protein
MSSTAERLIAAGHQPKRDEDGDIDNFAIESEYHNGPMCEVCYAGRCQHCDDGSPFEPCPGQEEMDRLAKERRYNQWVELNKEFGS